MQKKRKRDMGKPTVIVEYTPATDEEVLENRRNLEEVLSKIYTDMYGTPLKYEIEWGEKPENYGRKSIMFDGKITYFD